MNEEKVKKYSKDGMICCGKIRISKRNRRIN